MRRVLKLLLAGLLFSLSPCMGASISPIGTVYDVSAMNLLQDPNGFADLRWGEPLTAIQESHRTKLAGYQSGTAAYHVLVPDAHNSVYFIGPVIVRAVFMDNRLVGIIIPFSKEDFDQRLHGMTKLFGNPEKTNSTFYTWKGPFTVIILTELNDNGIIMLTAKPQN